MREIRMYAAYLGLCNIYFYYTEKFDRLFTTEMQKLILRMRDWCSMLFELSVPMVAGDSIFPTVFFSRWVRQYFYVTVAYERLTL